MVERGESVIARHLPEHHLPVVANILRTSLKPGSHVVSDAEASFAQVMVMGQATVTLPVHRLIPRCGLDSPVRTNSRDSLRLENAELVVVHGHP
jgi:hypothetical protein